MLIAGKRSGCKRFVFRSGHDWGQVTGNTQFAPKAIGPLLIKKRAVA